MAWVVFFYTYLVGIEGDYGTSLMAAAVSYHPFVLLLLFDLLYLSQLCYHIKKLQWCIDDNNLSTVRVEKKN